MNPLLFGTIIAFTYGLVLFAFMKWSGITYTEIGRSTETVKKGIIFPVICAGILLFGVSVVNGWIVPAFTAPSGASELWMWAVPASLALGIVVRLLRVRWSAFDIKGALYLLLAVALVGFTEEFLARGLLVHFFSQAGLPQFIVMVGSSLLFGLLHGMNYFNGQDRKTTTSQMIYTSITGMALYTCYIVSGTLWVPIALHALFDLSLLALRRGDAGIPSRSPSPIEFIATFITYTGAIIVLINLTASWLVT